MRPSRRAGVATGDSGPGGLAFFAGVVRRHRTRILLFMLAAGLLGGLYWMVAPRQYKAEANVLIDYKRLSPLDEDQSVANGRIDAAAIQSQITLINSEGVLRKVVQQEKLADDPDFVPPPFLGWLRNRIGLAAEPTSPEQKENAAIEALQKVLDVDRVEVSYVIYIAVSLHDAAKAARLANTIATTYIADQLEAKQQASRQATDWFRDRISDLQNDVDKADSEAVEYRSKNNIILADGKFIDEQQVSDLSSKLLEARNNRFEAIAKLARITAITDNGIAIGTVADEFTNRVVIDLRNKMLSAQRNMQDLMQRYGPDHESVLTLKSQIEQYQTSISAEFRQIEQSYKSDVAIDESQEKTLEQELRDLTARSMSSQAARVTMTRLESNRDAIKNIRDSFASRYLDQIQRQSFPITEARVVGVAQTPLSPVAPRAGRAIGGGMALGFGLGFFLALCGEAFATRIATRQMAEAATRSSYIGFLPQIEGMAQGRGGAEAGGSRPRDAKARAALGLFSETIRSIKVAVDMERLPGRPIVVGVASILSGEGASTVAENLAMLFAASDRNTLLVDADLRRQTLTQRFSPRNGPADAAAPAVRSGRSVISIMPRLDLSMSGRPPSDDPSLIVSSSSLLDQIRLAATDYETLIVDLPPLAPAAIAAELATVIDVFVLVIEWNRHDKSTVEDALDRNAGVQNKLVGVVLNKVDLKDERLGRPEAFGSAQSMTYFDRTGQSGS